MLYIAVFIVIIAIIILVWITRLVYYKYRATRLHHTHDTEAQRAHRELSRPTFRETAAGVSQNMFPTQQSGDQIHVPFHHRSAGDGEVSRMDRGAVNRGGADDGDPELPSYNDHTTVSVPPQAYATPEQLRRDTTPAIAPTSGDAPPKYA